MCLEIDTFSLLLTLSISSIVAFRIYPVLISGHESTFCISSCLVVIIG